MMEHDNRKSIGGLSSDESNKVADSDNELEILRRENAILLQNLREYRSYVDNINATIVVMDPEGIITYVSPNWTNLLGHELEEVLGKSAYDAFIHPDDVPLNKNYMAETLAQGIKNNEIEYRIRHKDGSWRWHSTHGSPILDENGKVVSFLAIARDISDSKAREQKLRESESRYRLLVETMREGVVLVNNDDVIQYINPSCCAIFGRRAEELTGKIGYDVFVHPDDRNIIVQKNKSRLTGVGDSYVVRGLAADGHTTWLNINGAPIANDNGEIIGSVGIMSDITESKLTAEALQRSEEKYRLLYDNIIVGVFQYKFDGTDTSLNQSLAMMFAYDSPEDMLANITEQLSANPEELERFMQVLKEHGRAENFEMEMRKKNGETFWSLISARLVKDEQGNPDWIEATSIDISKRKQAEQEKFELLSILDNSVNEIFILNSETLLFEYANQCALRNLGYTAEGIRKKGPLNLMSDVIPDTIGSEFMHMLKPLITGEKTLLSYETYNIRKDGSKYPVEIQIQCYKEGTQAKYFVIINDITESKSLKEQVLAAQKLDAIGLLAGGIAHDFNNLLTIILGYAEELMEELGDNDFLRMEAEEIVKAGKRASGLTRQLLTFSRKQVVQPQLLDVNDSITNLQKMLYRLVGEEVVIETVLADDLGIIKADPGQIEQIIINMALNARDAMPNGGEFRLETSNLLVGQDYLRNNKNVKPGIYVALAIKDNGKGMSKETMDRLFEPFFTTKAAGQGLGLGLSTVYGIVKQAEGQILVDSEEGKGTCFTVLIPASEGKLDTAKDSPDNNGLMGKQEHLLIVEDDKALLHFLSKLIISLGYKVTGIENSMEALALIEQGFRPDLVLSDVVMPVLNGKEMSDRIKKIIPDQKVIFMSGYTGDALFNRGILEKGIPFIHKPFTSKDIAQNIHDILSVAAPQKKAGIEILMLDDEESIRILLQRACMKKGHHLTGCGTLEEALQALGAKTFDILLLDMHLGGMDGIQALQKIRDAGFKTPVIVLTGAINPSDAEVLASMGAIKTMEKSFDNQPLLNFIEAYMVKN